MGEVIEKTYSEIETIQEIVPVEIESDAIIKSLPHNSNFTNSMREMLGSLMNSRNSLKITQDEFGQAKIFLGKQVIVFKYQGVIGLK